MTKTSFILDDKLLEKAKIQAIKEKSSLGKLLRKIIEEYLKNK